MLSKIFRSCLLTGYGIDLCHLHNAPKLKLSPQLLRVSKRFLEAGVPILYGENDFAIRHFQQLENYTAMIGTQAAASVKEIILGFNPNCIYSAQDFQAYSKLQRLKLRFDSAHVIPHHAFQRSLLNPWTDGPTIIAHWPLSARLAQGAIVPSSTSPLMPPNVPFFAECILNLVRDVKLEIEARTKAQRDDQFRPIYYPVSLLFFPWIFLPADCSIVASDSI